MTSSTTNPNHRSTMRRKARRSTRIAAACVLAASAPATVEAFGQRPAMISAISMNGARHSSRISSGGTASSNRARTAGIAKSHRRQTSLGYRDGDDDQSPTQRMQHRRAVSSTASFAKPTQDVPAPPASDSKRPGILNLLTGNRRRKITARNNHTDSEQFKLDEYLEYIDRRYKRMHGSDFDHGQKVSSVSLRRASEGSKKTSSGRKTPSDDDKGISTAWNWLMQGSSSSSSNVDGDCGCDAACQEQKRQDALEVLGLAGLASAELLRKHQLPVPEDAAVVPVGTRTTGPSIASSTDIIDVQPSTPSNTGRLSLVATQHRLERFTALLALTVRSILYKTVMTALLATKAVITSIPTLPAKVGQMAGGRKTVKMATAVALGVFCVVVKPLGLLALRAGGQN